MLPWAHLSPNPKWHVNQFNTFYRAHDHHRPTDYATLPVTIGRIYSTHAVLRCGLKKILIYETAVKLYLSTNLHFNGRFTGKPGLPCFPCFLPPLVPEEYVETCMSFFYRPDVLPVIDRQRQRTQGKSKY